MNNLTMKIKQHEYLLSIETLLSFSKIKQKGIWTEIW